MATAFDHIYGYAPGLDMTRHDLPCKPGHFGQGHTKGSTWLKVNGPIKQQAMLNHTIWSVAEQILKLLEAFELFPGGLGRRD